jgi:hypothetical protein
VAGFSNARDHHSARAVQNLLGGLNQLMVELIEKAQYRVGFNSDDLTSPLKHPIGIRFR